MDLEFFDSSFPQTVLLIRMETAIRRMCNFDSPLVFIYWKYIFVIIARPLNSPPSAAFAPDRLSRAAAASVAADADLNAT